jgi:hypothetical protein
MKLQWQVKSAPMTVETQDKLIALLAGVDEMKTKEAQFKSEKTRHLEQIELSEGGVQKCNDELNVLW